MRGRDCVITMPIPLLSYCHGDGCDCLGLCVGVPLKKTTSIDAPWNIGGYLVGITKTCCALHLVDTTDGARVGSE